MACADHTPEPSSAAGSHALAASAGLAQPDATGHEMFRHLVERPPMPVPTPQGVVVGQLLGLAEDGCTALVIHPGQATPVALRARSVIELRGAHVGREVLLGFVQGDPSSPVVLGVLVGQPTAPGADSADLVELDADGQRLVISAQCELVLRCGKSRLVLRSDGRVELRGETVVTQAARVNRIRGGSVELN